MLVEFNLKIRHGQEFWVLRYPGSFSFTYTVFHFSSCLELKTSIKMTIDLPSIFDWNHLLRTLEIFRASTFQDFFGEHAPIPRLRLALSTLASSVSLKNIPIFPPKKSWIVWGLSSRQTLIRYMVFCKSRQFQVSSIKVVRVFRYIGILWGKNRVYW